MGKFKKGDWVLESDAEVGKDMRHHGYFVRDVLPGGKYLLEVDEEEYAVYEESWLDDCTVEPRCIGWDWVLPEPANRFGLKVGDKVTIGTHDGVTRCCGISGTHVVSCFEETYHDGIARITLYGNPNYTYHPYWFGLCQSDGSPLSEKPATKTVVLEEWCYVGNGSYLFTWKLVGEVLESHWFKTGVTRELEVPNE